MARDGQQAFRPLRHVPYAVNPLAWTWPDVEQGIPRRDHAVDQAGDNGPPGTAALDSRQLKPLPGPGPRATRPSVPRPAGLAYPRPGPAPRPRGAICPC